MADELKKIGCKPEQIHICETAQEAAIAMEETIEQSRKEYIVIVK